MFEGWDLNEFYRLSEFASSGFCLGSFLMKEEWMVNWLKNF